MSSQRNILFALVALIVAHLSTFSLAAFGQDYTTTIASCTVSTEQDGSTSITCTPNYANPFADLTAPVNLACPHAKAWGITGNGHLLASTGTGLYTTFSIKQGTTLTVSMQGVGGVACTYPHSPLSLWVGNSDPTIYVPGQQIITYCSGQNPQEVAYGYVPDVSCSFTPAAGSYKLYFGTNIGINTHTAFLLTVTP